MDLKGLVFILVVAGICGGLYLRSGPAESSSSVAAVPAPKGKTPEPPMPVRSQPATQTSTTPRPTPRPAPAPPETGPIRTLSRGTRTQRLAALNALGQIPSRRSREAIAACTQDPDERLARRALLALAAHGNVESVKPIEAAARSDRAGIREAALYALSRCDFTQVDRSVVLGALRADPQERVRVMAAHAAGALLVWDAVPALVEILGSANPVARENAYGSLKKMLGIDYGFDPKGDPVGQSEALEKIRKQWPAHKPYFDAYLKRLAARRG